MSTDTFTDSERGWLVNRGFAVTDAVAEIAGAMRVHAVPHGHYHFLITITLPGGNVISGFVPRSRIVGDGSGDASSHRSDDER